MKIVVDANIVFSALLNTNSKIGDLLLNSQKHFIFIAPEFLRFEIRKHQNKLVKISGLGLADIQEIEFHVFNAITFISESQVRAEQWESAFALVNDVDPKDIPYVAFAKHFRCKLWSGDKELINGLSKKGFTNFVNTTELFELRKTLN